MDAMLRHAPEGTPVHQLARFEADLGIPAEGDGGYLRVTEVAPTGFADYLWGAEVHRAFEALDRGFSLATSLHAGSIDEAFAVLCRHNALPDALAARLRLVVVIRVLGRWQIPERRVIASVHEVLGVSGARPDARLLHRWDEATDTFEEGEAPLVVGSEVGDLAARLEAFR